MKIEKNLVKKSPTSPGQRHTVLLNLRFLDKRSSLKKATKGKSARAGRNKTGKITVYTKGGGHKRLLRKLSLMNDSYGIVESIEYDPGRTSNIARVYSFERKIHFYMLAPELLEKGHIVRCNRSDKVNELKIGSSFQVGSLPLGVSVYNVAFSDSSKGFFSRSAGCSARLLTKTQTFCRIRLPSGEERLIPSNMIVSLGTLSNSSHKSINIGKAGRSRWLNRRPSVRGVAMNPVDHPHGGGEGKTSGGRPSVTPWGKVARGQPTSKSLGRVTSTFIVKNRKVKKRK